MHGYDTKEMDMRVAGALGAEWHAALRLVDAHKRISELKTALEELVHACDVNDLYEEDSSDRPAMIAARAALRKSDTK